MTLFIWFICSIWLGMRSTRRAPSGANLAAAVQFLRGRCKGKTIASTICDSGLKYFSTDLWP